VIQAGDESRDRFRRGRCRPVISTWDTSRSARVLEADCRRRLVGLGRSALETQRETPKATSARRDEVSWMKPAPSNAGWGGNQPAQGNMDADCARSPRGRLPPSPPTRFRGTHHRAQSMDTLSSFGEHRGYQRVLSSRPSASIADFPMLNDRRSPARHGPPRDGLSFIGAGVAGLQAIRHGAPARAPTSSPPTVRPVSQRANDERRRPPNYVEQS
jgi:hypothetical protein